MKKISRLILEGNGWRNYIYLLCRDKYRQAFLGLHLCYTQGRLVALRPFRILQIFHLRVPIWLRIPLKRWKIGILRNFPLNQRLRTDLGCDFFTLPLNLISHPSAVHFLADIILFIWAFYDPLFVSLARVA